MDLAPQYTGSGGLLIHYGSPVITAKNTVLIPVKTGATGGFLVEARAGQTGAVLWSLPSDYRLPNAGPSWTPSFNPVLTPDGRLVMPASRGRLLVRSDPDAATGTTSTLAFYGTACDAAPATCDNSITINTPLTSDSHGNVFFGFSVSDANPAGLLGGGIARVAANGTGTYVLVSTAAGTAAMIKPMTNSAPALSADESTVYVVVNNLSVPRASGQLLALDSETLATKAKVSLVDPYSGVPAWINDIGTSSPTVGPDGDVYIGVLESAGSPHHFRGWLLHFDGTLSTSKTPASFGWDITASIVPTSMIPGYTGPSSYLLAIKYNDYATSGGSGQNRMAVVDPGQTQADPVLSTVQVMKDVITILGPTPNPDRVGTVEEWCINTVAVDPLTSSVLVNSEDGKLYRWHLPTNSFTEQIALTAGLFEAYTPTAIGPDGRVYAINNATLFSIGR
ncbi:MAG: hypothetical protein ABI647_13085 [Gemmatimonadota bacterium]